ncbi:FAD synthase [Candidatus Uhrbacteria bacterium]|nr:FAD synthase [Candidatus Uhrbacteria bacterium]
MIRKNKKDTIVMVFGVFDILHPGHLFFLKCAKQLGTTLIVIVARDRRVQMQKGRSPIMREQDRLCIVRSLHIVNKAILGDTDIRKPSIIAKVQPDVIAIGYDQDERHPMLLTQLSKLKKNPKIVRIKAYRPDAYSSTQCKKKV